ncbi:hypothetical protein ACFQS7_01945 [Dankookia sp. GCM10030260]|uniref:hypothetical protein n=1 Tax=Dankookia sp. GCM10030260 TaxID=3273390 RepID=UPI003611D0A1
MNLVIVDQGLPADFPSKGERGDGWSVDAPPLAGEKRLPFTGKGRHAAMVARNALAFAKEENARLRDCPLLSDRIDRLGIFLSYAHTAFGQSTDALKAYRDRNPQAGAWVVVNAWAVRDTRQDQPLPPHNHSSNIDHALNKQVADLDERACTRPSPPTIAANPAHPAAAACWTAARGGASTAPIRTLGC